ncbi:MAG TPA: triose-phosphate isomerase [Acidimicrobiales bacterium]|nr:triose-phosphate isomerase [Acidimicrobiales bacterium]
MKRGVRPLVLGNWKMNLDFVEAVHLTQQLTVLLKNKPAEHTDVVVVPPFVDLRSVTSVIASERIDLGVGAQHVNSHDNGAHTGEISVAMLQRLGVGWVIVGHSERRSMYAMDDATVARTLAAVVRAGLRAVLCVGEDVVRREAGEYESFVAGQLRSALTGLDERYHEQVSVAYEPIWAIGAGATASRDQVEEMTGAIRAQLEELSPGAARILYGGSVNEENAGAIMRETTVDGFLVGGASLKAESFGAIIRACDDCYAGNR